MQKAYADAQAYATKNIQVVTKSDTGTLGIFVESIYFTPRRFYTDAVQSLALSVLSGGGIVAFDLRGLPAGWHDMSVVRVASTNTGSATILVGY